MGIRDRYLERERNRVNPDGFSSVKQRVSPYQARKSGKIPIGRHPLTAVLEG